MAAETDAFDIGFRHLPIDRKALTRAVNASGIPHPARWIEGYAGWPV